MQIDTVQVLSESLGITTARVPVDGDDVVLRRLDLSQTGAWSWQWLEGELKAVRRARLPHVVPTAITSKGLHYVELTRPFIAGVDIGQWFAQRPGLSVDVQLGLICDLFYAIGRLHRIGVAHGGVKPTNVFLTDGDDRLLLVDASVTRTQLAGGTSSPGAREAAYLPPQSAALAHPAGFTADIFAAGWVLLEALAEGNRTAAELREVYPRPASQAELSDLIDAAGVPVVLRHVFLKLLSPLSGVQYENADEVLAAVEAVLATGNGTGGGRLAPTAGGRRAPAAVEAPLIGRQAELARLSACASGAARSAGAVTILSGESGIGKSRLLEAVAAAAGNAGLVVLRAGAFDQGPARPLDLFSGVFQDVIEYLAAEPLEAKRVPAEMSDLLPTALLHVPGLSEVFGGSPAGQASDGGLGDRSLAALPTAIARLLCTVFTNRRPGVILVDDCQWADDLSWQVLAKLAGALTQAEMRLPSNVSLICACRPEALAQVKAWTNPAIEFLDLLPLSMSETEALIRSLGTCIPDEITEYVARCSNGYPLEALLVFRALIDSSALRLESDRWVMDENGMASLLPPTPSPESTSGVAGAQLDTLIAVLLNPLSPVTRHALTQAAIFGRQFSSTLLTSALQDSLTNVDAFLFEAEQQGIVRGIGGEGATDFEFTHDRVREAVLRTSTEQNRCELHFRAAEALKGLTQPRADYDIAYHLARSGRSEAAIPYALSAGEQGLRHNALDVAESNFKIAEVGAARSGLADDKTRLRIHEGLGTVYMLLGSYDLAASELARAYELSGPRSALETSRLTTLLGELAFKTGRFDDAATWMRQSVDDLGIRMPRNSFLAALFTVGEIGLLGLGWLGRKIRDRRADSAERDRLAAVLHCRLVYEWWFVRSPIWIVLAIIRSLRFASASGSIRERAQAYSTAAVISGLAPALAPLAVRLTDRSLKLCRPADEGWVIAQSYQLRGFALYAGNRYDDAIDAFDTAISALAVVGDRWEQVAAMWQKALCLFRLGKVHDAGVLARETYWESKRRGDRIGAGTALAIWVRCLPADVSMATVSRELSQPNADDHTLALLHSARAWLLFNAEHYVEALEAFEHADELLRRSKIKNHFLAPILISHLQVCRLVRDSEPPWTAEHRYLAVKARRLLIRAQWLSLVFSGERPAVRRDSALVLFAKGKRLRGRFMLAACAYSALRYSARGEAAACSLIATRIGLHPSRTVMAALSPATDPTELCRQLGIRVDRGIVESAHSRAAITAGAPGHQAARQDALLDAVRDIVASQDVDEVFDKLCEATFATTTARRVEITDAAAVPSWRGHSDASPAESRGKPRETREMEMKLTERIAKPVMRNDASETSIVTAFPLGEGERYEPTIEVLAALSRAVIEWEGLRQKSIEQIVEVQEAERGRIARDLHDEFGHLFAAVMDGLGSLQSSPDTSTRQTATDIGNLVRKGMKVARSVAWSLRPSGLDDLGLMGCVEQYVEDCRQLYPVRIELTTTGQPAQLSPAVATAVFRIVQEALTNVGRHSHSREASVILVFTDATIRAIIEDNGTGFDTDAARQRKSLGLIGMHERARLVGGRLVVESRPGQGTTVLMEVPIRR